MTNLKPFQIALYFGFGILFIVAIFLLNSVTLGDNSAEQTGSVAIWGTLDNSVIQSQIATIRGDDEDERFRNVTYRQIDEEEFDSVLVNAIAEGRQPDAIILPHTKLVLHRNKLLPIGYDVFPRRDFQDTYTDAFAIFTRSDGLYALPLAVDPLMMYWNRDIFSSNGLADPPRTWETLTNTTVPTVVRRDVQRRISVSPIAFGHYNNVHNAYSTLSMLLLQGGSSMVQENSGTYQVALNQSQTGSSDPLSTGLEFYLRFGDSGNTAYSWSRTKQLDTNEFIAGNLALYFAHGSEYSSLRRQNPNLNFDVAEVPQAEIATTKRTYGNVYGLSILRTSDNQNGAYAIATTLTNPRNAKSLADTLEMAPPHRTSINAGNPSPAMQAVYTSSLFARGWLNPAGSDELFQQTVEDLQSGRNTLSRATSDLLTRLKDLF